MDAIDQAIARLLERHGRLEAAGVLASTLALSSLRDTTEAAHLNQLARTVAAVTG